jgi:CheY-like chemotaxis protein
LNVLVIEDDDLDAVLLVRALRGAGYAPLPVLDRAETALAYLQGAGASSARDRVPLPALILLDLTLPWMSGLEFLEWIQQEPRLSAIPVVVLSGST